MKRVVILLCVAAACGSKKAPPAASGSLWALAPPRTEVAIVVREGALSLLLRGTRALATKAHPKLAEPWRTALRELPIDVLDDASLAAAGLDLGRGAALFVVEGHHLLVAPASDGSKLKEELGEKWRCVEVQAQFVCADAEAALAGVGDSAALADQAKQRSPEMRGDIEVFVATPPDVPLPIQNPRGLWIAAQLAPGAITVRAWLGGKPTLPPIPPMSLTSGVAAERPAGVTLAQVGTWLGALPPIDVPVGGGLNLGMLVPTLTGEIVGWVPPGASLRGTVRLGVRDAPTVKRFLDSCDALAKNPALALQKLGDRCKLTLTLPNLPGPFSAETWLEGGMLAIGFGDQTANIAARGELSPFARELLEGKWAMASWGRGLLAAMIPNMLRLTPWASQAAAQVSRGFMAHLTEIGFAVGWDDDGYRALVRVATPFENPDEVVASLEPLLGRLADGDASALPEVEALAARYPDSPLAADVRSGGVGLASAMFVPGIVASVAIPAFMKNAGAARK